MRSARRPRPMRSTTKPISPRSRNGSGTPTSPPLVSTITGRRGRRTVRLSRLPTEMTRVGHTKNALPPCDQYSGLKYKSGQTYLCRTGILIEHLPKRCLMLVGALDPGGELRADLLRQQRRDLPAKERGDLLGLHVQHRLTDQLLIERSERD